MVDVVFVLLLFFMACAGMRAIEQHLPATIPQNGAVGEVDPPLVLDVGADGAVACNGLALVTGGDKELERLRGWLKDVARVDAGTSVIIRPHGQTEHERFVQVLGTLHSAGLKKISFQ